MGIISHTTERLYQSSCTSCREAGGLPRNIPEESGGHHSTVPPSGLVKGKGQQWYCPSLPRIYATRPSTARSTACVWASRWGKRMGFPKRGWCAVEGPVSPEASWAQVSLSGKNWPARTVSGVMSTYSLFLFFFFFPHSCNRCVILTYSNKTSVQVVLFYPWKSPCCLMLSSHKRIFCVTCCNVLFVLYI